MRSSETKCESESEHLPNLKMKEIFVMHPALFWKAEAKIGNSMYVVGAELGYILRYISQQIADIFLKYVLLFF